MRGFKHPVSCNSKTWHRSWRWLSACWWLWQLWLQVVDFKRLGTESSQIFQRWPNASSSLLLAQWQEVEMPWSCFAFLPPLNASNCNSLLLRFYTMLLHLYRFLIFTIWFLCPIWSASHLSSSVWGVDPAELECIAWSESLLRFVPAMGCTLVAEPGKEGMPWSTRGSAWVQCGVCVLYWDVRGSYAMGNVERRETETFRTLTHLR